MLENTHPFRTQKIPDHRKHNRARIIEAADSPGRHVKTPAIGAPAVSVVKGQAVSGT
jgi:hypothetical protein